MDCTTARMLVCFARPAGRELAPEDARALDDHRAACPACDAFAARERSFDDQVGRAMRAVEVPDRLRAALLKRLKAARGEWYLRWARRAALPLAAAAVLVLSLGGWHLYSLTNRPAVNFDDASLPQANINKMMPPDREQVEQALKRLGHPMVAPPGLNYAHLTATAEGEFQGRKVPLLVFAHTDSSSGRTTDVALVYLLSERQFDLAKLPADFVSSPGYAYQVEVVPYGAGKRHAYVLVRNSEHSADWLRLPVAGPAQ